MWTKWPILSDWGQLKDYGTQMARNQEHSLADLGSIDGQHMELGKGPGQGIVLHSHAGTEHAPRSEEQHYKAVAICLITGSQSMQQPTAVNHLHLQIQGPVLCQSQIAWNAFDFLGFLSQVYEFIAPARGASFTHTTSGQDSVEEHLRITESSGGHWVGIRRGHHRG